MPAKLKAQTCQFCNQEFFNARTSKYCCKSCGTKGWKRDNAAKVKATNDYWNARADHKAEYQARKEKMLADPAYAAKRREARNKATIAYQAKNREAVVAYQRSWEKHQYQHNTEYRLKHNLRSRVGAALRAQRAGKDWSLLDIVGCTTAELVEHLEAQFEPGMSWDNWSPDGWHIDHIRPCASFDLADEAQQRQCFHFTNLQPLWAKDNLSKRDSFDDGPLPAGERIRAEKV